MVKIHSASGDSDTYVPGFELTGNSDSYLATFIWRLLGHKDKNMRCKAAHVLFRASLTGNIGIVHQISVLYNQPLSQNYLDQNNYFFIDSAKLWYLATCMRIGHTAPKSLTPLYSFFNFIACAEGVVHALHRRIAKDICLQLAIDCAPQEIDDKYVSYQGWLASYLPGKDGFWCFEFRNHIPLLPFLWEFEKLVESEPEHTYLLPDSLAQTLVDHNLGLSLDMAYHAYFQQSSQYIRVKSAFVEKEDIDKLVGEMKKPHVVIDDLPIFCQMT